MAVTIIVSIGENNEIGRDGDLCWHIRDDLKHFKELTMGFPVIMGRKTWESLPKKPLPGRLNIVVTSNPGIFTFESSGAIAAPSLDAAIEKAAKHPDFKGDIYIIGGATIYHKSIRTADRLEITRIHATDSEADTFFPEISEDEWVLKKASPVMQSQEGLKYQYLSYENRRNKP